MEKCFHCGQEIEVEAVAFDQKQFCCNGCKTVYEILNANELQGFYDFNSNPGIRPDGKSTHQFDFLDTEEIFQKIIDFSDDGVHVVNFYIPVIHCTSCIWLLESLHTIHENIVSGTVNFPKKEVQITFKDPLKLSELAKFLTQLGYKPSINLNSLEKKSNKYNRQLLYKLAIAGFCFGNIMLIAFPEYVNDNEEWLEKNKIYFRWAMFLLSLPIVFYCSTDYFKSAWQGLKQKFINVDVPIAIGILVLFLRSTYDIVFGISPGYFDTLAGLLFFMLIGRWFQQQTYSSLAFDRDYKSFYPIAVAKIEKGIEQPLLLPDLKIGDRIRIKNEEIVPADGILMAGKAMIDNSFVTGESRLIPKKNGDKIFAGGKQSGEAIEIEVVSEVNQSYLTQLWNNDAFKKEESRLNALTNKISQYFTFVILFIAIASSVYWYFKDSSQILHVLTSILIIACPCALALSSPFILGHIMRIFGEKKLYVKNTSTIENLAKVDTIIFDKTGTLTVSDLSSVKYSGDEISVENKQRIKTILKNSNHPLSRILYQYYQDAEAGDLTFYEEIAGSGQSAIVDGIDFKIGSAKWVDADVVDSLNKTIVYIKMDNYIVGNFVFSNVYRKNLVQLLDTLNTYKLVVLSGDNDSEREYLETIFPKGSNFVFKQSPSDKLKYVENLQKQGAHVLMLGDGLNDAGALKISNVGISVSEDMNSFSPSCDAILNANSFVDLKHFLNLSQKAMLYIKIAFAISFLYNIVGLGFAVSGRLEPVVAAILMPISSISVVLFAAIVTRLGSYFTNWNLE